MRDVVASATCWSGMSGVVGWRYGGAGVIFMLHSVVDEPDRRLRDPLRCPLSTLEMVLRWARAHRRDVVSLEEAVRRLDDAQSRRFVVLTFDDGYRDNVTKALPLLERYAAPLTIYVTSQMITRDLNCWWDAIVPLVRDRDCIEIEPMGRKFDLTTAASKGAALKAIRRWVHEGSDRAALLQGVFAKHGIVMEELVDAAAMTVAELQRASAHPLVSIGGHTHSHDFLNRLTEDDARQEIVSNKLFLEDAIQKRVVHFAYPYGAAGAREAGILAESGFATAVTTQNGCVFAAHAQRDRRLALPRAALDGEDTPRTVACHAEGVFRFLKSRAAAPVASFG